MHEFTLFLVQHWLPVGGAAIVFFLVGMLLSKFIWGRYSQRLSFAVEENLNLASQWSALGASQRDLFKKLRSRWQADRDVWETRLAEAEEESLVKEARISQLVASLEGKGESIPAELSVDAKLREEVAMLKTRLEEREREIDLLREEAEGEVVVSPLLSAPVTEEDDAAQTRIQELEQDLIDTHDELHRVREDSKKQAELIESLEAKLIETGEEQKSSDTTDDRIAELEAKLAEAAPIAALPLQTSAMLRTRSAEIVAFREEIRTLRSEYKELRADYEKLQEEAADQSELEAVQSELAAAKDTSAGKQREIDDLKTELSERAIEIEGLRSAIEGKTEEVEKLTLRLADLDLLEKRRVSLQADLNDAHHEMYDVRKALNERLSEIELLEAGIDEWEKSDAEAQALADELHGVRKEFSEAKIALAAKSEERDGLAAQMEELEAIIEDRGAEVEDLSKEVRAQRDQIRGLKEALAEKEGELEALAVESNSQTNTITAKQNYLEQQADRIDALEEALAARYKELNDARARLDDESKSAKYHASRAEQLESEFERRRAEFDASGDRLARAEDEIERAQSEVQRLTALLEESDGSLEQIRGEVQALSREKDESLRQLERASKRIEELESAARERETRIVELEAELRQGEQNSTSLQRKLDRLAQEMEEANRNRDQAQSLVAELEENLRGSDDETLRLSRELESKDAELESLRGEIVALETTLAERDEKLSEATKSGEALRLELEEKLSAAIRDREAVEAAKVGRETGYQEEIQGLQSKIAENDETIARYEEQRRQSVDEIETLRTKVAERGDSIRELQSEISNIMMQRSARDNEITMLKDKLRSMEEASESAPSSDSVGDLEDAIRRSLEQEQSGGSGGLSLDEIDGAIAHHAVAAPSPKPLTPVRTAPEPAQEKEPVLEDDGNTIFFDESSSGLSDLSRGRVDEFAREVRRAGGRASVAVIGFAGPEGSAEFNESLGAKRADAVRERLIERGVPQARISVRNSGQDRRFTNWRARRVELVLVPNAVAESVN